MRRVGAILALLLAGPAWADDALCPVEDGPSTALHRWTCVQRAKLADTLVGDSDTTLARYAQLVRSRLTAGDPSLSDALYWLGAGLWEIGDVEGARDALDQCIRTGLDEARCVDLRGRIDLEVEAVHRLPVHWTFDTPDHGFFHPRPYWDLGVLRLKADDATSALAWATRVDPVQQDRLVVGFRDPMPAPAVVAFRARSAEMIALLDLVFVDVEGRRWRPRDRLRVPLRTWTTFTIDLGDLVPDDEAQPPLVPTALHRLVVLDATALTGRLGRNEIQIDDFEVRAR